MADGFSDPDPADVPQGFEEVDPEDLIVHDGSISCTNCQHRDVCKLVSGFQQMIEGEGGEQPIDAEELAVVCDEYLPEGDEDEALASVK